MEKDTRVGLGFAEALTILFTALKLCGVIDWPWLWVVSPIWISIGLVVVIGLVIVSLSDIQKRDTGSTESEGSKENQ